MTISTCGFGCTCAGFWFKFFLLYQDAFGFIEVRIAFGSRRWLIGLPLSPSLPLVPSNLGGPSAGLPLPLGLVKSGGGTLAGGFLGDPGGLPLGEFAKFGGKMRWLLVLPLSCELLLGLPWPLPLLPLPLAWNGKAVILASVARFREI